MKKANKKKRKKGPIAQKAILALKKHQALKVTDLGTYKEAKQKAEQLEKTVISGDELSGLDPLHGVYAYAQNRLSIVIEQLSDLPSMARLANAYADAEEEYMPSGPPMSPLTGSYFACWGFFDLCFGIHKESLATVAIEICKQLKADSDLIRLFSAMQESRMGIYLHEGIEDRFVYLKEYITGRRHKAVVPSGYLGKPGQVWFVRLLESPFPELDFGYSVVFITPYILTEMVVGRTATDTSKQWAAFFNRTLKKANPKNIIPFYENFMKYGLNKRYWNEFIFEAYLDSRTEMIRLAGFPDMAKSRPHSRENEHIYG